MRLARQRIAVLLSWWANEAEGYVKGQRDARALGVTYLTFRTSRC